MVSSLLVFAAVISLLPDRGINLQFQYPNQWQKKLWQAIENLTICEVWGRKRRGRVPGGWSLPIATNRMPFLAPLESSHGGGVDVHEFESFGKGISPRISRTPVVRPASDVTIPC
jgi:hypothetical protein